MENHGCCKSYRAAAAAGLGAAGDSGAALGTGVVHICLRSLAESRFEIQGQTDLFDDGACSCFCLLLSFCVVWACLA